MARFVGRQTELDTLARALERVRAGTTDPEPGKLIFIRGRRRVGKSRLVEQFLKQAGAPSIFFTASRRGPRELATFVTEIAGSKLPNTQELPGTELPDWDAALSLLGLVLPDDTPSVVVIDEFPYLLQEDSNIEATFQKMWDRVLKKKPVLLLLVGSDLAVMEMLSTYGRPLFQRGTDMVVPALTPVEVGEIIGADSAATAFDAFLITGGMPMLCDEWPSGKTALAYLGEVLAESSSMLITGGSRTLDAELPTDAFAREVLSAIGSGERTFTNIKAAAGGLNDVTLTRSLETLTAKRIVSRDLPVSTKMSKEPRYRIVDPYLQFWLRFIGSHFDEIDRGRSDLVLARITNDWSTWRGKAVEPVVRLALERILTAQGTKVGVVGAYWTRTNIPEVDIVVADGSPRAKAISFAGSIKWRESAKFDQSDLAALTADAAKIPGVSSTTPLIAVGRVGVNAKGAALSFSAEDLIEAWK